VADIISPRRPAVLQLLMAASTIVLLGQSCQCPTTTRFRRQTNEQKNSRTLALCEALASLHALNN